jgi:Tol biopolymer transport system component
MFYVQYPEGQLWRAKNDGTSRVQLTPAALSVLFAAWSPDAKQIAFCGSVPGGPWKIYLIPAEGGDPRRLLNESINECDPSWSPDGSSLAFGRLPWKTGAKEPAEIYVLDLKSGKAAIVPGSQGLFGPHWSPDGRHLLASKADSSAFLLYDFVAKKWTTLATGLMGFQTWSRDSSYIYALDGHVAKRAAIIRIRVSDGKLETAADVSAIRQIAMPWVGLDQHDTPLAIREVGTEDIYALEWSAH